jgi:hypothetical protein
MDKPQIEVSGKAAFFSQLLDTLASNGYLGVLQIAVGEHHILGARLTHSDQFGFQTSMEIPINKLDLLTFDENGKPIIN